MKHEKQGAEEAMNTNNLVAMELVAELGKVRVEWADGRYAYMTPAQVDKALRSLAPLLPAHATHLVAVERLAEYGREWYRLEWNTGHYAYMGPADIAAAVRSIAEQPAEQNGKEVA